MPSIDPLVVKVIADTSGLSAAMGRAKTAVNQFAQQSQVAVGKMGAAFSSVTGGMEHAFGRLGGQLTSLRASLNDTSTGFGKFGSVLASLAAPLAIVGGAAAGFKAAFNEINNAEELAKTAAALGVTTEALQRLNFAAETSGSSASDMQRAMHTLSGALADAGDPASKTAAALESIGLAASAFDGLSVDAAFLVVADALKNTENQSTRAQASMALLGKSGREMGLLLENGSEGIKAAGNEAEKLGVVISKADLAKLQAVNDSFDAMWQALRTIGIAIAKEIAPAAQAFADSMSELGPEIATVVAPAFGFLAKVGLAAFGILRTAWDGLVLSFLGVKVVLQQIGVWALQAAKIGQQAWQAWEFYINGFVDRVKATFDVLVRGLVLAWMWWGEQGTKVIAAVVSTFGAGISKIAALAEKLGMSLAGVADAGSRIQKFAGDMVANATAGTDAAKKSFDLATAAAAKASHSWDGGPDFHTEELDKEIQTQEQLLGGFVDDLRKKADQVREQVGGMAIVDVFAKMNNAAASQAGKGEAAQTAPDATRAVSVSAIVPDASEVEDKETELLAQSIQRYANYNEEKAKRGFEYRFDLWKNEQDLSEKLANLNEHSAQISKNAMLAIDVAHVEFVKMREVRDKAFSVSAVEREKKAAEDIANIWKNQDQLNKARMAEIDKAHAEWTAMRQSREYAAIDELKLRKEKAEEENAGLRTNWELQTQARVAEIQTERAKHERDVELETRAQWESGYQGKMQVAGQFFSSLTSLMDSKNKQMFEIGKAASIAETVISTIQSAQESYRAMAGIPYVGPALGIAAAAAATAAGMARVQQIRSTKFGSGGSAGNVGGGSSMASATAASQPMPVQQSNVNVSLVGERFSATQVRGLIGLINDQTGDNVKLNATVRGG